MLKNKKGFTVVELLAIVAILCIIAVIALPQIDKILNENKNKKFETYAESIENAAKLYVDSYSKDLFSNEQAGCRYIKLNDLINKNLAKDIKLDDTTCNVIEGSNHYTYVKVNKNKDNYKYDTKIYCEKNSEEVYGQKTTMNISSCSYSEKLGPTITISGEPDESIWLGLNNSTYSLEVNIKDDSALLENATIEYRWVKEGETKTSLEEWITYSYENKRYENNITTTIPLPEDKTGKYQLQVKPNNVRDSLGNYATEEKLSKIVKLDTEKPDIPTIQLHWKKTESVYQCPEWYSCWWYDETKNIAIGTDEWIKDSDKLPVYATAECLEPTCKEDPSTESGLEGFYYSTNKNKWYKVNSTDEYYSTSSQDQKVYYKSCDKAGNCSDIAERDILIDYTPPKCQTYGGNDVWTTVNINLVGGCTDNESGCKEGYITKTITDSQELKASPGKVEDIAGNTTECPEVDVKIDRVAPKCTTNKNASGWTNKAVTVTGKCEDPKAIDWNKILGFIYWPTSENGSGCVNKTISVTYDETMDEYVSPGIVSDNAGNESLCDKERVQIDKEAPNPPSLNITKTLTNATIRPTATDNGPSGVNYYKCSINGSTQTINKGSSYTIDTIGSSTISCKTYDKAGNYSADTTEYVTIQDACSSTKESTSSSWSSCSATCGGGIKTREVTLVSTIDGSYCGTKTEQQSCNTQSCPPKETILNQTKYDSECNSYYITTCTSNTCTYTKKNGITTSGTINKTILKDTLPSSCEKTICYAFINKYDGNKVSYYVTNKEQCKIKSINGGSCSISNKTDYTFVANFANISKGSRCLFTLQAYGTTLYTSTGEAKSQIQWPTIKCSQGGFCTDSCPSAGCASKGTTS